MKKPLQSIGVLAAATLALGLAGPAAAQSTWNLSYGSCDPTGSGTSTTAGCTVDNISAQVTGWATSTTSSSSLLERATLTDQGGSGIGISSSGESSGSPNHAIDNSGKDELVLINFGTDKVNLTGLATGWSFNDTDLSVLRWDGGLGGPDLTTMSLTGTDPATALTLSGWTLVGSADLDGAGSNNESTFGAKSASIADGGSSSWWIITAYFGAVSYDANGKKLDKDNDYYKLLSFSGTCTSNIYGGECGTTTTPGGNPGNNVPEPTSLALVAAALLGAGFTRRRKRAA